MKVSDYIVRFLIDNNITDVFGYPGGMVTHLMDSFSKNKNKIKAHVNYNEQASSFAACGYAQASLRVGVAYATSGPGATNLITGICNAYFDSIPSIFITGQVNTYESKNDLPIRQKGFQEMDIVSMISNVTKYSVTIREKESIRYHLEKAIFLATNGRPGPVLIDLPMNIQREDIDIDTLKGFDSSEVDNNLANINYNEVAMYITNSIESSNRPCFIIGAGIRSTGMEREFQLIADKFNIPVVSSMIAVDAASQCKNYFGFVGAYGHRTANMIISKSDLIISIGSRLDIRQTGAITESFGENARLLRIDIDEMEFKNVINCRQENIYSDIQQLLPKMINLIDNRQYNYDKWLSVCKEIKNVTKAIDNMPINDIIENFSSYIESDSIITTDVGQNQVWVAQSFINKGQKILFSGGHGAMGYSLPAAIGAYYASKKKIISFNGDGGIQMNIQELEFIRRENLPIKVVIINNYGLGMIRHFQEMYFECNYTQTKSSTGYSVPDFSRIASVYDFEYAKIRSVNDIKDVEHIIESNNAAIIEIELLGDTYVYPKLAYNKSIDNQEPEVDRELYEYIKNL